MQRDSGIKESEVLTFSLFNFDPLIDKTAQNKIDQQILRGLPNVIDATSTNMLPLSGGGWSSSLKLGPDPDSVKSTPQFAMYLGTDHTINTLGIKLIEGRNFYPHELKDNLDSPSRLAIMTSTLAKAIWPDESALGKVLYEGKDAQITVIGVVEKLQGAWIDSNSLENSIIQNVDYGSSSYMVRAKPEHHAELKDAIKKALLAENPNRVLDGFKSIEALKEGSYRDHQLMITVLTMMVVLLLLITSLGLTGMVMFNIQRRTKQIGTRRALGAKKRDIINYFLVENYLICLAGGVLGGLLAIQLGQQLMKIYSLPMLTLSYPIFTVAGLFMVTTLAVYLPARKAANISPATATRTV